MHNSHSEERQLSLPITLSSSGDDHLLTARADDDHFNKTLDFGQCHDNRAFQYHNNNNNNNSSNNSKKHLLPRPGGSGKSQSRHESNSTAAVAVALDDLEVVIVHKPHGMQMAMANGAALCTASNNHSGRSCCHRRKRHNATQTSVERCCCMSCHCHVTAKHHHCHHHCHHHHYFAGDVKRRHHPRQQQQHQHHHELHSRCHHHHQQNQHQQRQHSHPHPHPHPPGNSNSKVQHNKSSLDSSDEHRPPQLHSAAIAIEIDAATVTENNSSTATSNFPYKVASEGGGAPMNLTPLCEQHRQRRRGSLNSNTTIGTDELSRDDDDVVDDDDDDDDDDVHLDTQPEDEERLTPSMRARHTNSSSSSTARAFAASAPAPRNECVRIKRKRFVPDAMQDYCSSCSRCSSCSCDQARTSSCSSLDDELAHELTVSADCHRCMAEQHQQSNDPSIIRRSSLKSFCSCHTNSCCCGEDDEYAGDNDDDDDDEEETTGQRESFCTAADHTIVSTPTQEELHSSTLTPLSTQDHTMRSELAEDENDGGVTDADASSLSQSAEYFSLASTVGGGQSAAAAGAGAATSSKCCEKDGHGQQWSKHIRLKRSSSPLDSHL